MDNISEISIENTVTVKVDCLLNQDILAKNFAIIMNCLKDLKNQQDQHSASLNGLSTLKEMFDKFREEINNRDHNNNNDKQQTNNEGNNDSKSNGKSENNRKASIHSNHSNSQKNNAQNDNSLNDLLKEIELLKNRMSKNEGFTNDNTNNILGLEKNTKDLQKTTSDIQKDTKDLQKQMANVNEEIQNLKKLINGMKNSTSLPSTNNNTNISDKNLSKNENLQQQSINHLNNQAQQHDKNIKDLLKQMENMKKHMKDLNQEIEDLKNRFNDQTNNFNKDQSDNKAEQDNKNDNIDLSDKSLNDIMKKIDFLTKKTDSLQNQSNSHSKNITKINESVDQQNQQIGDLKEGFNNMSLEIQEINNILNQLQKVHNDDSDNLLGEIQRLKDLYEKLLKMINSLKNNNADNNLDVQDKGSSKNVKMTSQQDKSFRRRSDSVDLSGKIKDLTDRIKYLQKMIGDDNPEKLPSISFKKPNQTAYNGGEKSHKKQLAEMKNELQIWIKNYLATNNKNAGGNFFDLQLKIQQIKNLLSRKADHQGMKKGLAFLQGKITQLYLFLTQPDAQDAMIVRKGFNCLSCSKKVQTLRGKLGPRMNWDNLNSNPNHTPPKLGFPKYADSNEKESI